MKKASTILIFIFTALTAGAQTLVLNGTVSGSGTVQDDVLIDIYEYNSPIQTLHSDSRGYFSLHLLKGKEYILVFYKSGFTLQSFSISDSKRNPISNYYLTVNLEADDHSPDGLYFKQPVRRIVPESTYKYFTDSKFSIEHIKPRSRADSVLVLLNRAQTNQYILVGNMKMGMGNSDSKYSQQLARNVRREISSYADQMRQNTSRTDSLQAEEDEHQRATMTTTGDTQLVEITETQRLLASRLSEVSEHYLLEQQRMLAKARLDELSVLEKKQELANVIDSAQIVKIKYEIKRAEATAMDDRYQAMDANRKFQFYNKQQELQYQEYIELLRYKNKSEDSGHISSAARRTGADPKPLATIAPADTSDNLSKMRTEKRTDLIRKALEEEERFKNYREKTEVKDDVTVKDIHIADDDYEMQVDKKGNTRYFKNAKPVTRITFEFETTRRMVDVLNTIKQVDKFGR